MTPSTNWWPAPSCSGPLQATVELPGSKSQTNRALLLGAISSAPLTLTAPLLSRDTLLAAKGLRNFGVDFRSDAPDSLTVVPPAQFANQGVIDCGLAGTVLRFFPALAAFGEGSVRFEGDKSAEKRPLLPLLEALEQVGAKVTHHGKVGFLPFTITGIGPGATLPLRVLIDSSASSQFLSALLLASPLAPTPFMVDLTGPLPSRPHVEMTLQMLADQGVSIQPLSQDRWMTDAKRPTGRSIAIEPDLSNAGPFLAAALICGGSVTVPGWPATTTQAGSAWEKILPRFGATVERTPQGLQVTAPAGGRWDGVDLDLGQVGELAPTVAALCALAQTPSELHGIGHLRGHETDRLAALKTEIERAGGAAEITDDGLQILPGQLRPTDFESYEDHRMATFGALLSLALPGSRVNDIDTTAKTLPDFVSRWQTMLAGGPSPTLPSLAQAMEGSE